MSDTIRIKPAAPEMIVRDPVSRRPLAAEGETKPRDQYWTRRLRDGDVVLVEGDEPLGEGPEDDLAIPPVREA